jgi:hypothetical protein
MTNPIPRPQPGEPVLALVEQCTDEQNPSAL